MSDDIDFAFNELLELTSRAPDFSADLLCFPEQRAFVRDPARFRVAVCSRRAGKTVAAAVSLLEGAINRPGLAWLYLAPTRINAKRIIWRQLNDMASAFGLGVVANETELTLRFQNGSIIYLGGAKDEGEVEKHRGQSFGGIVIDEAHVFRPYLRRLIDDVLVPTLWDTDGWLAIIGTPGPVPTGVFWEAWVSPKWSRHHWTIRQNPWIERMSGRPVDAILLEERQRRGVGESDPTYRREALGEWCEDPNALVFRYDDVINHYDVLPKLDSYVMGVDLGYHDADAVAVLGWSADSPDVYLVEEYTRRKESYTDLIENGVMPLRRKYPPLADWWDFGGMNQKAQLEIRQRWGIPAQFAEKSRKLEHISLLNDALRTGRFKARKDSRFAEDCRLVTWAAGKSGQKVSDAYHSDITDACLYAYRAAGHWRYEKPVPKVEPGVEVWRQLEAQRDRDPWDTDASRLGF
jgi:hypothetical protein